MSQCPCPISIRDPRGTTNAVRLTVPCGKCPVCLQNKRADWSFRLNEEMRTAESAHFLTLTYSDEKLPEFGTLVKSDVQKFNKRLRKNQTKKIRFYAVGEYGTKTNRPHYHGIYFGIGRKTNDKIEDIWGNGQIMSVPANQATIHYVTKYVINHYEWEQTDNRQKPFALMSNRPAIGHNYIKRNEERHIKNQNTYVVLNGYKQKMPAFYKGKIFTESEREKHAKLQAEISKAQWEQNPFNVERRETNDWIENQFRIINKQSKSQ